MIVYGKKHIHGVWSVIDSNKFLIKRNNVQYFFNYFSYRKCPITIITYILQKHIQCSTEHAEITFNTV